ncbi:MAG: hypothetical protein U1B80_05630 [Anaerolineaceae bacterium]|nr:hypothetical protein [Anaerolineaceae bacterium]
MSDLKYGTSSLKVSGGKMVRIDIRYADCLIEVKLTGDFFLHPEETITAIEDAMTGARLPLDKPSLLNKINAVLLENQAQLIGATPEDVITVLEEALA